MEADYRLIAESAEDSIFILDSELMVAYVNVYGAGLLGGSPEMIVGQHIGDLFPKSDAGIMAKAIAGVFATGRPGEATNLYRFRDREVWLSTRLIPIRDPNRETTMVMGFSRDITSLKKVEETLRASEKRLQGRLKHFAVLNEFGSLVISGDNLDTVLIKMTEGFGKGVDVDEISILKVDFTDNTVTQLTRAVGDKNSKADSRPKVFPIDDYLNCVLGMWKSKESIISHYDEINPSLAKEGLADMMHGQMGIKTLLWHPFNIGENDFYVLAFYSKKEKKDWSEDDINFVGACDRQLTVAMQRKEIMTKKEAADKELKENLDRLKRTLEDTVNALAVTAEKKDPTTAGHQQRVVKLAGAIAKEMGLSDEKAEGIRIAATVHDIGKIYIPVEILSKPGKLSDLEFGMVQAHSQFGFDILKTVDFPWPVAKTVFQHHERLDGSGYPLGLKGDEICQEARILAVADVVEAMLSHRPYRAGVDLKEIIEELRQGSGVIYDAAVADACAKILASKEFSLD